MLRDGCDKDLEAIVAMSRDFWQYTQFKDEEFQPEMVEGMALRCMEEGLCLVYEVDHAVVGFICGIKGCLLANGDVSVGSEVAWWVNPDYRDTGAGLKLLKGIERKAKSLGIKYWSMIYMQSSMPENIKRIYDKMGYELSESLHTKAL